MSSGSLATSDLASGEGLLSSYYGKNGRWQTTLPLDYGDSGGPVFDISGMVAGVAVGGYDDAKAMTFVVPGDYTLLYRQMVRVALDLPKDVKTFPFATTAEFEQKERKQQLFCVDPGLRLVSAMPVIAGTQGSDSGVMSISWPSDRTNCVELETVAAGRGVDKIGPIVTKYKGVGWVGGYLEVRAEAK